MRSEGDRYRSLLPGPIRTARRQGVGASFSFFIGRTLTFTVAGLALKVVGSPVNGLMPLRAFFAGTATAVILRMPGSTKVRGPFLLIEARLL